MTALKGLSAANARQVLVDGRVADAVTQRGLDDAALELGYDPGKGEGYLTLPVRLVRRADGWFAFHLKPKSLPQPNGAAPALRLSASAPGHGEATEILPVGVADLELETETRTIADHGVTLERIKSAPFSLHLALDPLPVALSGHVFVEGDVDTPAVGADVAVTDPAGPSATTDGEGAFSLPSLPVAAEITVRVTHEGESRDHIVRPDFTQRINRAVFATA